MRYRMAFLRSEVVALVRFEKDDSSVAALVAQHRKSKTFFVIDGAYNCLLLATGKKKGGLYAFRARERGLAEKLNEQNIVII